MKLVLTAAVLCTLALPACIDRFETRAAYESERFLCADEDTLPDRIEACDDARAAGEPCEGVLSFTGDLERQPVTVEVELGTTILYLLPGAERSPLIEDIDTSGAAPYFRLLVAITGLATATTADGRRFFELGATPEDGSLTLDDGVAGMALRLTTGGESVQLHAVTGSGWLSFEALSMDVVAGSFAGAFGRPEDRIEGCFFTYATSRVRRAER